MALHAKSFQDISKDLFRGLHRLAPFIMHSFILKSVQLQSNSSVPSGQSTILSQYLSNGIHILLFSAHYNISRQSVDFFLYQSVQFIMEMNIILHIHVCFYDCLKSDDESR